MNRRGTHSETAERPGLLESYGWARYLATGPTKPYGAGEVPARVIAQHRGGFELVREGGFVRALTTATLRRSPDPADHPTVGDWVTARPVPNAELTRISAVMPRRSAITRASPGSRAPQVLAANVDVVFIVETLERPLNLRRLERFLVVAWDGGATPVLALSKADLCPDVAAAVRDAQSIARGAAVCPYSAVTGEGLEALAAHVPPGHTAALLGPSGAGKSTLVNRLMGARVQREGETRAFDGKGRHTTTARHLLRTPSGALLIDTPGLRALQLWDADDGLEHVFDDIEEIAAACRFSDCTHRHEPGCAVLAAIARGELSAERLASYRELDREVAAEAPHRWRSTRSQGEAAVRLEVSPRGLVSIPPSRIR